MASTDPVIGPQHPDVIKHTIQSGFETGQYFTLNGTHYYTANELGTCAHSGILWDLVTRAALWSAPASSGPWSRLITLRNGSHMQTVCQPASAVCAKPCSDSCCSGTEENPSSSPGPQLLFTRNPLSMRAERPSGIYFTAAIRTAIWAIRHSME